MNFKLYFFAALVLVLFGGSKFPVLSQKPANPETWQDSLDYQKQTDTSRFKSENWLAPLKGKALIQLTALEEPGKLLPHVNLVYRPDVTEFPLNQALVSDFKTIDPYDIPGYDFREDPNYQFERAGQFVLPDHTKAGNVIMFSPFAVLGFALRTFKNVGAKLFSSPKDPAKNIFFKNVDIKTFDILWENPGYTLVELYQQYCKRNTGTNITYLIFKDKVGNHVKRNMAYERDKKYSMVFSRQRYLSKLKDRLLRSDAVSDYKNHFELLRMKDQLENGDDDW